MKLLKTSPKLKWLEGHRAKWVVQLHFDNGETVEVEDYRTIRALASCAKHWVESDAEGASFLPRLEGEELKAHLERRKHEMREEEKS